MKILHLISGLGVGGAETMLYNLLTQPVISPTTGMVVSLTEPGPMGERLEQAGITVHSLGMRPGSLDLRPIWKLVGLLQSNSPDLIQTWMYHADLLGGLAARLAGNIPVVWGIHHTLGGEHPVKSLTMKILRLNAVLSRWLPKRVICCAESARQAHTDLGYFPEKMIVIPNGIDPDKFRPDPHSAPSLLRELGLEPEVPLIGMFARFHPQKDHRTLIEAAASLHSRLPHVHFVLAGDGITSANGTLQGWLQVTGMIQNFHLLGLRQDMPRLMAGVDIATLSSAYGEALPLVIAEGMACGIPCVVTDVGDSSQLVGNTGKTVPPGHPIELAAAWEQLLNLPSKERTRLGQNARSRIQVEYNIATVANRYAVLYNSLLS